MLNLSRIVFVIVQHSLQYLWFVSTYPVAAVVCLLKIQRNGPISSLRTEEHDELAGTGSAESLQSSLRDGRKSAKSPYTKVQTLSFQIYTGGAPAFTVDKSTGKERTNHECKGCEYHSV